jgi:protein SCO1/2
MTGAATWRTKRLWWAAIISLSGLLLWLIFCWQPAGPPAASANAHQSPPAIEAVEPIKLPAGGDFTLQSPSGPVSLADFRGRVVLIYFGYTFCPDVCPTALALLGQALGELTAAELKQVQALFITLDPERDSLAVMNVYAPHFHPTLLGLNGSPAQVAQVARQYGVRYMKQQPNADGQYAVDHSSFTYLVAGDGKLAAALPHATSAQQIVAMIRAQLRQ